MNDIIPLLDNINNFGDKIIDNIIKIEDGFNIELDNIVDSIMCIYTDYYNKYLELFKKTKKINYEELLNIDYKNILYNSNISVNNNYKEIIDDNIRIYCNTLMNEFKDNINMNKDIKYFYYNNIIYSKNIKVKPVSNIIIKKYLYYIYLRNIIKEGKEIKYEDIDVFLKQDYSYYINIINCVINNINNNIKEDLLDKFLIYIFDNNSKFKNNCNLLDNNINNKINLLNLNKKIKLEKINELRNNIIHDLEQLKYYKNYKKFIIYEKELDRIKKCIDNIESKTTLTDLKIKNKKNSLINIQKNIDLRELNKKKRNCRFLNIVDNNYIYKYSTIINNLIYKDNDILQKIRITNLKINTKVKNLYNNKKINNELLLKINIEIEKINKREIDEILKKKYEFIMSNYIREKNDIINKNDIIDKYIKLNKLNIKSYKKKYKEQKKDIESYNNGMNKLKDKYLKKIKCLKEDIKDRIEYIKNIKETINVKEFEEELVSLKILEDLNNMNKKIRDTEIDKKRIVEMTLESEYNNIYELRNDLINKLEIINDIKYYLKEKQKIINNNTKIINNIENELKEYYNSQYTCLNDSLYMNKTFDNKYINLFIKDFNIFLKHLGKNIFYINNFYNIKYTIINKDNDILNKNDNIFNECIEYKRISKAFLEKINIQIINEQSIECNKIYLLINTDLKKKDILMIKLKVLYGYKREYKIIMNKLNDVRNYIKKYN